MGVRFTRASSSARSSSTRARPRRCSRASADSSWQTATAGSRFRHGLLRDAAYHGLSFRRRRALHRRVGESLESAAAGPTVAGDLTHHFYEAGAWEKALRYGFVAGRSAQPCMRTSTPRPCSTVR